MRMRFNKLMWGTDLLAIRGVLALSAILYGAFILCNPTNLLVSNMLTLMPYWAWSLLFLIQGLVMSWSLLCDKRPRITLWADAILGTLLWTASTIACLLYQFPSDTPVFLLLEHYRIPPSMVPNIALTGASWWILVRHYVEREDDVYGTT